VGTPYNGALTGLGLRGNVRNDWGKKKEKYAVKKTRAQQRKNGLVLLYVKQVESFGNQTATPKTKDRYHACQRYSAEVKKKIKVKKVQYPIGKKKKGEGEKGGEKERKQRYGRPEKKQQSRHEGDRCVEIKDDEHAQPGVSEHVGMSKTTGP